jgi:putative membrane protein
VFWSLILQIIAGIVGLFIAQKYVDGVHFNGPIFLLPKSLSEINLIMGTLVFVGAVLGVLNHFVKPILKKITLPLRIITLDLFSIVILMFLVWLTNVFSPELTIQGLKALFFTALIVWVVHFILSKWLPEKTTISK